MESEEGRARFVAQARPLISQIEAPALGTMLRRRLGELARLSAAEVEALIPSRLSERRSDAPPARTVRRTTSNAIRLLALLCNSPAVVAQVPEADLGDAGVEYGALRAVAAFFREDSTRTLAQASAYFEGSEHAGAISEALEEPLLKQAESPDFDEQAEVEGLVERLRQGRLARRKDALLERLKAGTATAAEKAEYGELHAQLAHARSGNPVAEAGSKF